MYLPPAQITLFNALTAYCTRQAGRPWDELEEDELQRVALSVRDALASGRLIASCVGPNGFARKVDSEFFIGLRMWEAAFDPATVSIELDDGPWTGRLVVNREEFEAAVDQPVVADLSHNMAGYVPPYVAFMLDLVERFELVKGYKFQRESIARWLLENPSEVPLGLSMSGPIAEKIVTFISDPAFHKGGNNKFDPKKRSSNPFVSFEGQNFPKDSRIFPKKR